MKIYYAKGVADITVPTFYLEIELTFTVDRATGYAPYSQVRVLTLFFKTSSLWMRPPSIIDLSAPVSTRSVTFLYRMLHLSTANPRWL